MTRVSTEQSGILLKSIIDPIHRHLGLASSSELSDNGSTLKSSQYVMKMHTLPVLPTENKTVLPCVPHLALHTSSALSPSGHKEGSFRLDEINC